MRESEIFSGGGAQGLILFSRGFEAYFREFYYVNLNKFLVFQGDPKPPLPLNPRMSNDVTFTNHLLCNAGYCRVACYFSSNFYPSKAEKQPVLRK